MKRIASAALAALILAAGAACSSDTVRYASCAEAKDAGATPLKKGDAGYRSALDRDGDGVACDS